MANTIFRTRLISSDTWQHLSRDEQIKIKAERGNAPPEHEGSLVFRLWKKHRNEISLPAPKELLKALVVDSSLPKAEQVARPLEEVLKEIINKAEDGAKELTAAELTNLQENQGSNNPATIVRRTTNISKARLIKMYPELNESDLD